MKSIITSVYANMRELDSKFFKYRRKKLTQQARSINRKRKTIIKQVHSVTHLEQKLQDGINDYERLVASATRQLTFSNPEQLEERQRLLENALMQKAIEKPEVQLEL